jgi:hypothetical protein
MNKDDFQAIKVTIVLWFFVNGAWTLLWLETLRILKKERLLFLILGGALTFWFLTLAGREC